MIAMRNARDRQRPVEVANVSARAPPSVRTAIAAETAEFTARLLRGRRTGVLAAAETLGGAPAARRRTGGVPSAATCFGAAGGGHRAPCARAVHPRDRNVRQHRDARSCCSKFTSICSRSTSTYREITSTVALHRLDRLGREREMIGHQHQPQRSLRRRRSTAPAEEAFEKLDHRSACPRTVEPNARRCFASDRPASGAARLRRRRARRSRDTRHRSAIAAQRDRLASVRRDDDLGLVGDDAQQRQAQDRVDVFDREHLALAAPAAAAGG